MSERLTLELALQAAFMKTREGAPAFPLTSAETEQYYFSVGFKMGHAFKEFVIKQQLAEKP